MQSFCELIYSCKLCNRSCHRSSDFAKSRCHAFLVLRDILFALLRCHARLQTRAVNDLHHEILNVFI